MQRLRECHLRVIAGSSAAKQENVAAAASRW